MHEVDTMELLEFLQRIPKVEIHCHLFGTIRLETLLALGEKYDVPMSREELTAFYVRGEKPQGVLHLLRALDQHFIKDQEDLHRLTYEYLQDAHAHGVRYSEFFWNPTGTVDISGIPYTEAQDAIIRAIHNAETDFGIIGRLIPAIDREASPAQAVAMVEHVIQYRRPEVLGIGMDYRENDRPPEMFWKAYRLAKRNGLQLTAHAGEFGLPWVNVETAIDLLQVDRVDHGYTILDNPVLAHRCAEGGIVFTVVPSNSYYLRTLPPNEWAMKHPIRQMPQHDLKIHPNTDDPTFHNVTPTISWHMMVKDFGCGLDHLREFMFNGLDGAWISDVTRRQWKRQWAGEFDHLRTQLRIEPEPAADQQFG
jgi:adenosine deaminase